MHEFDAKSIQKDILIMGGYAEFMYCIGDEKASWRWLFLREMYKDFLRP